MIYIVLAALALCVGCAELASGVIKGFIAKDPEIERLKIGEREYNKAVDKLTDEKKIVDLYDASSRRSHPTFFSTITSIIHHEEGRRLAIMGVALLGSLGVMIWKIVVSAQLGGALGATIKGVQKFRNENPDQSAALKATLADAHSGLAIDMKTKVAKVLGEI